MECQNGVSRRPKVNIMDLAEILSKLGFIVVSFDNGAGLLYHSFTFRLNSVTHQI